MSSFKDLEIFQESRRLAVIVHKMSLTLPKFELYEEGSQLRRCSKAIAVLIAEGYGRRRYKADYIKYLVFSQAECDEIIVHLDLIYATESFTNESFYEELKREYDVLGKKINKFIQWVESHDIGYTPSKRKTTNK